MTAQEKIGLAALAVAVLGLVIRELHVAVVERKRSQPIVIAHEHRGTHFGAGGWSVESYLTNDGTGAAFNVRFGVAYRGVRYAYRMDPNDHPRGNRQTVINAGTRLPEYPGVLPILISSEQMWGAAALRRDGRLHESRVYWCRYENAFGHTWETRNPWDRSADLDIRRVRFVKLRERLEERKRRKAVETLLAIARAESNAQTGSQ
jgi:hypothetical protein